MSFVERKKIDSTTKHGRHTQQNGASKRREASRNCSESQPRNFQKALNKKRKEENVQTTSAYIAFFLKKEKNKNQIAK